MQGHKHQAVVITGDIFTKTQHVRIVRWSSRCCSGVEHQPMRYTRRLWFSSWSDGLDPWQEVADQSMPRLWAHSPL